MHRNTRTLLAGVTAAGILLTGAGRADASEAILTATATCDGTVTAAVTMTASTDRPSTVVEWWADATGRSLPLGPAPLTAHFTAAPGTLTLGVTVQVEGNPEPTSATATVTVPTGCATTTSTTTAPAPTTTVAAGGEIVCTPPNEIVPPGVCLAPAPTLPPTTFPRRRPQTVPTRPTVPPVPGYACPAGQTPTPPTGHCTDAGTPTTETLPVTGPATAAYMLLIAALLTALGAVGYYVGRPARRGR